jgi:hypothetical protein
MHLLKIFVPGETPKTQKMTAENENLCVLQRCVEPVFWSLAGGSAALEP